MADNKNQIPNTVINRLPRYYRYLLSLRQMGISRVSSNDLGKAMMMTLSQIRQDFFNFGGSGLQGYGYDVESLRKQIAAVLGLDNISTLIIVGVGSLGQALAKHNGFEKEGFKIIGIFDVNRILLGKKYVTIIGVM